MTSVHSHSQCETIRYFSLEDTIFVEGSVCYFEAWSQSRYGVYYWDGEKIPDVVGFLKRHPNIYVQVGFHTDIRPIPMTNDTLTFRWAVRLIDYIVKEGVDRDRMLPWGYGSTQPYCVQNDTVIVYQKQGCFFEKGTIITKEYIESLPDNNTREAAHSLNRQTELKILKLN